MGELIRAKDWGKTSLGNPADWPQSLKTMVSVMLDNPFGMYIAWGSEYTQLYNDGYRPILGATKHPQALGISTRETFSEIWDNIIGSMFDDVMKGNAVGYPDLMLPLNRNGYIEECYFDFSYSPIRKDDGDVGGVLVTVLETTDKKKAQAELTESTNQLKFAIDAAELGTWDYNPATNKFTANNRLKTWFGLSASEEIELHHATDAIAEKDKDRIIKAIQKVLDYSSGGIYEEEYSIINPVTKRQIIVLGKGKVWFNDEKIAYRFNGILQEVTENVLSRKKIEENEEKLRIAIEGGEFGTFDFFPQTNQLIWSDKTKELFGLPASAIANYNTYISALHPEDRGTSKAIAQQQANLKEGGLYELEYRAIGITDGKLRWLRSKGKATYNDEGEPIRYTGVIQDITEQKEAAEVLRKSHQQFTDTVKQAPVGICILRGPQYIVEMANDAYLYLVDRKEREFVGKPLFEGLPEVKEVVHPLLDEVFYSGIPYLGNEVPIPLKRQGEQDIFYFDFVYHPLKEEDGKISGIIVTVTEVSEKVRNRKKIEESKEAFEESKLQLEFILECAKGGYWDLDLLTGKSITSFRHDQCFGATEPIADWSYEKFLTYVYPEDIENVDIQFKEAVATGNDWSIECRVLWKDASIHWIQTSGRNYRYIDEKPTRMLGMVKEITYQKEEQQKIEESEQRFRLSLAGSNQIVFSQDKNLKHTWIYNPHPDFKVEDIIGKTDEELHVPSTAAILTGIKQKVLHSGAAFNGDIEIEVSGQQVFYTMHIEVITDTLGRVNGVVGTVLDITERIKAQQKIEESEERFRNVANSAPVLIWMSDTDKLCYFFNKGWLNFTGRTIEQETGNGWAEGVHPEDLQKCLDIYFSSFDKREPFYMEYRLKRYDGEYRWLSDNGVPRFTSDGVFEGYIGACMDINNEKVHQQALEESEEKFRLLADSIPQHIWTSDPEGNLNYYNQSVFDYSGLTIEQINQDGWIQIVHPDDREENIKRWTDSISTGKDFLIEHRFCRYDGVYRWQLSRAIPQKDNTGKIQMWVGTSTDIQEQKTREEKKDEFISIASHEMKTPLTTAKANLQMLERLLVKDNEKATLFAKKANLSVNRLNDLVSELLDVSKIRFGKLNYTITNFNFNDMIESTVENIQLTSAKHIIVKSGEVKDSVRGDQDRLQQVVINLLTNAIKYSPGAEMVFVNLEQDNDYIIVSVKDEGIGIAQKSLDKIFEKYHRVEENALHFQGLGIGLFISYEIIQRHNGKLWAESEPGKGSTFYFTIPVHTTLQ